MRKWRIIEQWWGKGAISTYKKRGKGAISTYKKRGKGANCFLILFLNGRIMTNGGDLKWKNY